MIKNKTDLFCPKLFRLNELYNKALLSSKQRLHLDLRLDEDRCDLDVDSLTFDETANHYCIKISKQGIINQGNCNDEDYNVDNVKLNSNDLEYIYNNGSWNCMYNSKNNKTIENIINNFFIQFKNETK